MKKIAIQLFGHLRTYRKTRSSFKRFLVDANASDGYQVDIFMHCWDQIEAVDHTWHNENASHAGLVISATEMQQVQQIYNPVRLQFETQTDGKRARHSQKMVNSLRLKYETESQSKYDWVIVTRPDILFFKPFRINSFLKNYDGEELGQWGLPDDFVFAANNLFTRMNVADPRHVCECDLLWFGKSEAMPFPKYGEAKSICLDYRLNRDFSICRFQSNWKRLFEKKWHACKAIAKKIIASMRQSAGL